MDAVFETNRRHWDELARIHSSTDDGLYDLQGFRAGDASLGPIETAELGDVAGKKLLHLQCHFGLDTMRLARQGAEVTGLDFSINAIEAARRLAAETSTPATFVEGNVYDAPDLIDGRFDIVFVSWGALCWLPDIPRWAEIVQHFLSEGGYLYLLEGHPASLILKEDDAGRLQPHYHYFNSAPVAEDSETSYAVASVPLVNRRNYAWDHPVSSVVNALLAQGLTLEFLNEHDQIPWPAFSCMIPTDDGMFAMPVDRSSLPLAYSLKSVKNRSKP